MKKNLMHDDAHLDRLHNVQLVIFMVQKMWLDVD